jgi:D-serine deaminase-like pyridoxal phosphate-dependent protein
MNLQELTTPSLLLDLNRVKQNAQLVGNRVKKMGASLRPHIKTHKCIEVARIQTEGHSRAVTVSTLEEGRVFAANGFTDITYAVPIEHGKFQAAIDLSRNCERLALITDSVDVPRQLNDAAAKSGVTINVFLKVDCGYHRCGVEPHTKEAHAIPRLIVDSSNLRFAGILTHAGHSYHCQNIEEVVTLAQHERDLMVQFATELKNSGIPVPTVSIGSTPTITSVDHLNGVDEVRPGNYIFFDAFQATLGSCRPQDCALTVLASVVHRDISRRKVIVDAGAIAMSKDRGAEHIDSHCGYGWVLDMDGNDLGLRVESMSQEHGVFTSKDDSAIDKLSVGTRVKVLANHSCLTAAQHSHYEVLDNDKIVDRWQIHRGW